MSLNMKEQFSLSNKIALVTGASRGLGKAIAVAYAEAGADVILVSRGKDALNTVAKEILQLGCKSWVFPFDLSKTKEIPDLFNHILDSTGRVDILANIAGTIHRQLAVDFPLDKWQQILDLNLTAPFVLSQCFAKACITAKHAGKIISIASLLSERARATIPAYTASKGAIQQLTKALAVEWAPYKINVNAVGPGYFETELTKPLVENEEFNRWVLEKTPINRWGQPGDLVGAAVFLASKAADFITGQIIYVDGGWLANM
ncbi:MAG: SDR family oxidoreductase [bacterium]|nr:MAG: SDR family oxidoreductase [bacterium]